ncbi:HD-GYP domain-containing protein [Desulfovibrio gilichinskyi]|uniref:Putative two-component system response regulator n=1 Tax=Desulfovibrio gilichinskyi TaxID=1519643 RepID=A0A1X7CEJ9_9BACT|nr:two-component system response regulator [Desulfovibrio gilichinskyi]SME95084.1 putative two-component system response regulator [Desulfovibrio gilichinskyi]
MSERKFRILVVDDEPHNRTLLRLSLQNLGYEIVEAENALKAFEVLNRDVDLVLTDVMMPEIDGFEMVRRIRANSETSDIPVIMVTTLSKKQDRITAIEAGANDFICKPVDILELKVRVKSMIKQKEQQDEIKNFASELNHMIEDKTAQLRKAIVELDHAHKESILHLCNAAEYKDEETAAHILRMSNYSALLAHELKLDREEVELIRISSPMHDVGKIGIPDSILLKPGPLDSNEWNIMKTHPVIGAKILGRSNSKYVNMGAIIAESHHEKWDGSGYPHGLSGENIPLPGRICAIADVFDALTSKRPYKEAFSTEVALPIMQEGKGVHFDPHILGVFFDNLDKIIEIKTKYSDL